MTKFVYYFRVSTERQGKSGLGLDAQRQAVEDYLRTHAGKVVGEFVEVESGKNSERPALAKAIALCRAHGATLLIAKLDRLARKVLFIAGLMEEKIGFVAADMPNATPFMLHIYAAVAEEEGRAISKRTKDALAAAKAKGTKLGNPHGFGGKVYRNGHAPTERADAFAKKLGPTIRTMRDDGLSLHKIADKLSDQGFKTPRGGAWTATAVRNVLLRAA